MRAASLSLYRRLLRAAAQWEGPAEEAAWIRHEARQQFEAHRQEIDLESISRLLANGESRLELGLHYKVS
jgi:hypothetical protein